MRLYRKSNTFNRRLNRYSYGVFHRSVEKLFGATEATLPVTTNLIADMDANASNITLAGSDVATWSDTSGNANHLTEATNRPLYNSSDSDFNTLPSVEFDGVAETIGRTSYTGGAISQPNTIFIVMKLVVVGASYRYFLSSGTTMSRNEMYHLTTTSWHMYAGAALNAVVTPTTAPTILCGVFNTTSSSLFKDGGTAIGTGTVGTGQMNGLRLGSYIGSLFTNCKIARVLVYDANLSDSDKNLVGAYLGTKYGITWTNI